MSKKENDSTELNKGKKINEKEIDSLELNKSKKINEKEIDSLESNNKISRRNFYHTGSFNISLIEKLICKMERKFSEFFSYVTLRNTVNGKGLSRCSINNQENIMTLILNHKYTKNNKQAKIVLGIKKGLCQKKLQELSEIFSGWLMGNIA